MARMTREQKDNAEKLIPATGDIDAMEMSNAYRTKHGEKIDWHEFAYLLDELHGQGYIARSGNRGIDGFTRYMMPLPDEAFVFEKKWKEDGTIETIHVDDLSLLLMGNYHNVRKVIESLKERPGEWNAQSHFALFRAVRKDSKK